jgi:8-oxoguanine DNA glycosylase-like protein
MVMTDLASLSPPHALVSALASSKREETVLNHRVMVSLDWWNEALEAHNLPGGPVTGRDENGRVVTVGTGWISRNDVFALAKTALRDDSGEGILRLTWHAFAWGSGTKRRMMTSRLDSAAEAPEDVALTLLRASRRALTSPRSAYELLRPNRSTAIRYFGPAFFTKVLYFAGCGRPDHCALILDDRVAAALYRAGWESLRSGPWPATTYERYCELLVRWAEEVDVGRPVAADEVERWLFRQEKA